MKRKTSKEILVESFREVAETKNIDKITVKDITDDYVTRHMIEMIGE